MLKGGNRIKGAPVLPRTVPPMAPPQSAVRWEQPGFQPPDARWEKPQTAPNSEQLVVNLLWEHAAKTLGALNVEKLIREAQLDALLDKQQLEMVVRLLHDADLQVEVDFARAYGWLNEPSDDDDEDELV
jgi:hypothetical protein